MIILCSGVLIFFLGTKTGVNIIFKEIQSYIPELTFDSVYGTWGNFNITHITYKIPSVGVITINQCNLLIDLKYIFLKKIDVKNLILHDISVNLDECIFLNKNIENIKLNKKLNIFKNINFIFIKNISLNNVCVVSSNIELQLHQLSTGVIIQNNLLKILPVYICGGSVVYSDFNHDFINKAISPKFLSKYISFTHDILKEFINNKLKIITVYNNFLINFMLNDIQCKNFIIWNNYNNSSLKINDIWMHFLKDSSKLNIKVYINFPDGCINTTGYIIFQDYYPLYMTINYSSYNVTTMCSNKFKKNIGNIQFIITGSLINELHINCNILNFFSEVDISIKVKLLHRFVPIEISIVGKKIPIVLLENNVCMLEDFNFHLIGNLNNYYIRVQSKLIYSEIYKSIYISLYAQGNKDSCNISTLKAQYLDGYCEIVGSIEWKDMIRWNSVFQFFNITIFHDFFKCITGLSGKIVITGFLCPDSWKLMVSQCNIYGNTTNGNIMCNGSVFIKSGNQFNVPIFIIHWGPNKLKISGKIKKNGVLDMILKLEILDASCFQSTLNGKLYSYCKLYGCVQSPSVLFKMNIYSLEWKNKNVNIDHVLINSDIHYNNNSISNVYLKIDQIQYRKNLLLNQVSVTGTGNVIQHNLNVIIQGNKLFGKLNLVGNFNFLNYVWNCNINKTDIVTPIGVWRLSRDINLSYDHISKKVKLKSHYWFNTCCSISVINIFQKQFLKKIGLIFQNDCFISEYVIPVKFINIHNVQMYCTDICWVLKKNSLPTGSILFSGNKLSCVSSSKKEIYFHDITDINLNILLTEVNLFFNGIVKINNNQNHIKFLITDLYNVPKVVGSINICNLKLDSFFKFLFQSQQELITGIFNVDLSYKGYLYYPKVYGFIKLNNFNFYKPDTVLFVKNSLIQVKFLGDCAKLDGIIDTGYGGRFYLNGNVTGFCSIYDFNMLLNIYGNLVNIRISPTMYAKISPNIICKITDKIIDIKGKIDIPYANIECQEFPRNLSEISSEEILLDDNFEPVLRKGSNFYIFNISGLSLHLGNDINFNGFGLHTKLKGDVEILYNENDYMITGQINTYSGIFKVYGKNLMIKKGQLLFSGTINQAYFDIEAIQNTTILFNLKDYIVLGIRINGTINELKLDFFSNSVLLSQQEIANYLLGEYNLTLSNIDNTDNNITSLLIGVSINRYEKLINKIGKALGVQDLMLNIQNSGSTSLLALSGYIAPGLQIKYEISIFDLLTIMTVRYSINHQLCLEAKSGGYYKSVDLLYKFDF